MITVNYEKDFKQVAKKDHEDMYIIKDLKKSGMSIKLINKKGKKND